MFWRGAGAKLVQTNAVRPDSMRSRQGYGVNGLEEGSSEEEMDDDYWNALFDGVIDGPQLGNAKEEMTKEDETRKEDQGARE